MLNNADASFADRLSANGIATRPASETYLTEMRGLYRGQGEVVALPTSTDEVSRIVAACADARVGIVPYGGGTGLVAGQVSISGPVPLILSLEKMNAIRAVHSEEDTLVAEAGATIAEIQRAASEAGRLFPLSYASQDSARIGGALAVNSGGLNVLRYGMARDLCLGIEAVMPNGDVLHGLKRLRKDNTGYDLRHLLIGSEGTLGIITAAALRLMPLSANTATAFLAVENPAAALKLLNLFRAHAGETVSAFELIPRQALEFLAETAPEVRQPFESLPDWCILAELATGASANPEEIMAETFEAAVEDGLVSDGQIAQSGLQRSAFWNVREMIPEANRRIGAIASHDISLPLSEVAGFIDEMTDDFAATMPVRINSFGHLGDGNLHFNIFPPRGETRDAWRSRAPEITGMIHDKVMERGGSFSAEHGLGRAKAEELARRGDPAKLAAMRAIKSALDPLGIMNPGAVLA